MKQMTLDEIRNKVSEAEKTISGELFNLWKLIRIVPTSWTAGEEEVWVVAIAGPVVIWYNDAEGEFVGSAYNRFGHLENKATKIPQSDVPDNMMALLAALRASTSPQPS